MWGWWRRGRAIRPSAPRTRRAAWGLAFRHTPTLFGRDLEPSSYRLRDRAWRPVDARVSRRSTCRRRSAALSSQPAPPRGRSPDLHPLLGRPLVLADERDKGPPATVVWGPASAARFAFRRGAVSSVAERLAQREGPHRARAGPSPASVRVVAVTKGFGPKPSKLPSAPGSWTSVRTTRRNSLAKSATAPPSVRWHFLGQPPKATNLPAPPSRSFWHGLDTRRRRSPWPEGRPRQPYWCRCAPLPTTERRAQGRRRAGR